MVSAFQIAGGVMFLYAPLGKLRHMLFMLTSRWYWGEFFGIRGVRPVNFDVEEKSGE